ncbi:hypothetical protein D3C81_1716960 [compost metagenome]
MHILDVATGTERTAIAGQHQDPHSTVAAQFSAEVDEFLDLLGRGQGIARVRVVHAHRNDAALAFNLKKRAHAGLLAKVVKGCVPCWVSNGQYCSLPP